MDPAVADTVICGICEDSREARAGDLFVALPGERADGADFVAQAATKGAVAAVTERRLLLEIPCLQVKSAKLALSQLAAMFYDHPTRKLFTAAVTGTNGKTSVCHFARTALGAGSTALLSTVESAERGISRLTTPSSLVIQAHASRAISAGYTAFILEASSAGIAQHRLGSVDLDAAVFTNLTTDHWAFHGTREAYREAKMTLFRALPQRATAILNAEDPLSSCIAAETEARILTYGIDCEAQIVAQVPKHDPQASTCMVKHGGRAIPFRFPIGGRVQVANALAALGVAITAGVSFEKAASRLECAEAIPGRMQRLRDEKGRIAIVDYAHNPDALRTALKQLRSEFERILLVFGAPGDGDLAKRQQMGEAASEGADEVILTSDNPKHEDPVDIMRHIDRGMRPATPTSRIPDRADAIAVAANKLKDGAVLLVAGKGHERVQWIGDVPQAHCDLDVLQDLGFVPES